MPLTFKEIAEIMRLIDASSCDELVVEVGDMRLAVRRNSAGKQGALPSAMAAPRTASSKHQPAAAPAAVSGAPEAEAQVSESASVSAASSRRTDGLIEVRSPMIGIFYSKPAPDAAPFVSVGSQVNKGDPLCLLEVMKLYTTIEAGQRGRIVQIAAEDGHLVQHNQMLFLIEPS
jgi:acetyl-CoA carboxylase biotin carboxyl carrier protein